MKNFQDIKAKKNLKKNFKKLKKFTLPHLSHLLKEDKQKKSNISSNIINNQKNIKQIKNIEEQLKKQKDNIQIKYNQQQQLMKNPKPFSGNPSIKINSNIVEINKPLRNNNQLNIDREIVTANPSLLANKLGFNYKNSKKFLNSINNMNQYLYNYSNDMNKKEDRENNRSAKYQYYQYKAQKYYKKIGLGVSKSTPKLSSLEIAYKPNEVQKQKESSEQQKNIRVIMSYNNNSNNYLSNKFKFQKKHKNSIEQKNSVDKNKFIIKNKQMNLGSIDNSSISNSSAQKMLMKIAGKIKLKLDQKHMNLKSATRINISNPREESLSKVKNNNLKLSKNISNQNIQILGSLNNTVFSTISPKNNNSNPNIKDNADNDNPQVNQPKISKNFVSYAYSEFPNLEHRKEMEDFHCIKQALGKNPNLSYFSIFDGHGGDQVSSFLSTNFHRTLIHEMKSINMTMNDEENIKNIIEVIKNSFTKIDIEILNNESFTTDVGSTATIIIIYYHLNNNDKNVRTLICANVGDSSGFLINKNNIKLITKPHKCENESEVKRVKEKGGIVFQGRIFGKLILTRTLGDKEMKKYGVISTPNIFSKIIENDDLFVVIGSDGIWDIIEEGEIYKMGMEKGLSSEEFSKKLINISKERDSRDNVSCIVIKLNKNNHK